MCLGRDGEGSKRNKIDYVREKVKDKKKKGQETGDREREAICELNVKKVASESENS